MYLRYVHSYVQWMEYLYVKQLPEWKALASNFVKICPRDEFVEVNLRSEYVMSWQNAVKWRENCVLTIDKNIYFRTPPCNGQCEI